MALWTCDLVGASISRANAEQRMLQKLTRSLTEDIAPLLPPDVVFNDAAAIAAFERVWFTLITRIDGDPWKTTPAAVDELRKHLGAGFLRGHGG